MPTAVWNRSQVAGRRRWPPDYFLLAVVPHINPCQTAGVGGKIGVIASTLEKSRVNLPSAEKNTIT